MVNLNYEGIIRILYFTNITLIEMEDCVILRKENNKNNIRVNRKITEAKHIDKIFDLIEGDENDNERAIKKDTYNKLIRKYINLSYKKQKYCTICDKYTYNIEYHLKSNLHKKGVINYLKEKDKRFEKIREEYLLNKEKLKNMFNNI